MTKFPLKTDIFRLISLTQTGLTKVMSININYTKKNPKIFGNIVIFSNEILK